MHPLTLDANQPADRFYEGGDRIAAFRAAGPAASHTPEDWVGSTTSVRGLAPVGQSRLADGTLLVDAIAASPESWLGQQHLDAFGVDTKLLVKLLDAGQRLPVHAHPHRDFAAEHLGAAHGKAEAWYMLEAGTVYLGLRDGIDRAELLELVSTQQTERMLSLMHRIDVTAHDTVYVPPGLLHAIGEGLVLVEVQEPEDLSILLEWTGFDLDGTVDGHLGLGFDLALDAVESRGRSDAEIRALVHHAAADGPTLVPQSAEYFRLDAVASPITLDAGFAILVALEGGATVTTGAGASLSLETGATVLVPFAAGALTFDGGGQVLVARPPLPAPPAG